MDYLKFVWQIGDVLSVRPESSADRALWTQPLTRVTSPQPRHVTPIPTSPTVKEGNNVDKPPASLPSHARFPNVDPCLESFYPVVGPKPPDIPILPDRHVIIFLTLLLLSSR
ncbi:hypothetical protein L209DRAFT_777863 [Thermothelomyces heterothallicus CBS 203.75]